MRKMENNNYCIEVNNYLTIVHRMHMVNINFRDYSCNFLINIQLFSLVPIAQTIKFCITLIFNIILNDL